jgi:predicted permease
MSPKIKNIIIFTGIAIIFISIYIFFIKGDEPENNLVSSPGTTSFVGSNTKNTTILDQSPALAQDFLSLLLNVRNIKLDDTIFSDSAFNSLRDSSIVLVPDGNEGRPNPFAPLGTDNVEMQGNSN